MFFTTIKKKKRKVGYIGKSIASGPNLRPMAFLFPNYASKQELSTLVAPDVREVQSKAPIRTQTYPVPDKVEFAKTGV